jgi:hypothetical protein
MRQFYVCLAILCGCFACKNKSTGNIIPSIPTDTSRSTRHDVVESLPSIAVKLGLTPLNNGADSFTYRFWFPIEGDSADGVTIVDISYTKGQWKTTQIDSWGHNPDHVFKPRDTINYFLKFIVDSVKKRELFPKESIDSVVAQISNMNLQNGPSQASLDSNDSSSSFSRFLEFAGSQSYRVIHIACKARSNQIPFNVKVMQLEKLLREQFGLKIKECREYDYKTSSPDTTALRPT